MLGTLDTGMDQGAKSAANHGVSTSCPKTAPAPVPKPSVGAEAAQFPPWRPRKLPLEAGTSWQREPHGHT